VIHAVSSEERERLLAEFIRFCEIETPSGRERGLAQALTDELRALGIQVEEDDTAPQTGSDSGNLIARVPGPEGMPTVLLCAHMDTVPLDGPVQVVSQDGASCETARHRRGSSCSSRPARSRL
jgi:tripeptide aminopeptidase